MMSQKGGSKVPGNLHLILENCACPGVVLLTDRNIAQAKPPGHFANWIARLLANFYGSLKQFFCCAKIIRKPDEQEAYSSAAKRMPRAITRFGKKVIPFLPVTCTLRIVRPDVRFCTEGDQDM